MGDNTKHKIKLSELQMRLIKESVEATKYLGIHSDHVSKVRRKMTVKDDGDDGETKRPEVADLVKRLPKRQEQ